MVNQNRLYYESHSYHSPILKYETSIDVVIASVVGISLLHSLPVLQG